jgi:hypothetical protein
MRRNKNGTTRMSNWVWAGGLGTPVEEAPEGAVGFVYKITNPTTGRFYIGKKKLFFRKTKQVKGKKKRVKKESDWQTYWGSNEELIADVKALGEDQFKREIIQFYPTLSECSYWEAFHQFITHALMNPLSYNSWIMVRVRAANLRAKTRSATSASSPIESVSPSS